MVRVEKSRESKSTIGEKEIMVCHVRNNFYNCVIMEWQYRKIRREPGCSPSLRVVLDILVGILQGELKIAILTDITTYNHGSCCDTCFLHVGASTPFWVKRRTHARSRRTTLLIPTSRRTCPGLANISLLSPNYISRENQRSNIAYGDCSYHTTSEEATVHSNYLFECFHACVIRFTG